MFLKRLVRNLGKFANYYRANESEVARARGSEVRGEPQGPSVEKAPTFRPEKYFETHLDTVKGQLERITHIEVKDVRSVEKQGANESGLEVHFSREGKEYLASFKTISVGAGLYDLECSMRNLNGRPTREIFKQTKARLDFGRVEMAIVFAFSQAFIQE